MLKFNVLHLPLESAPNARLLLRMRVEPFPWFIVLKSHSPSFSLNVTTFVLPLGLWFCYSFCLEHSFLFPTLPPSRWLSLLYLTSRLRSSSLQGLSWCTQNIVCFTWCCDMFWGKHCWVVSLCEHRRAHRHKPRCYSRYTASPYGETHSSSATNLATMVPSWILEAFLNEGDKSFVGSSSNLHSDLSHSSQVSATQNAGVAPCSLHSRPVQKLRVRFTNSYSNLTLLWHQRTFLFF